MRVEGGDRGEGDKRIGCRWGDACMREGRRRRDRARRGIGGRALAALEGIERERCTG